MTKLDNPMNALIPLALLALAGCTDAARMPFGKYAGVAITDLPSEYLTWFAERGFPAGRLGELLASVYEIKGV